MERLPDGERKRELKRWIKALFITHRSRILPINESVVRAWASLCAAAEKLGKTPGAIDSLLAASAQVHGLTLVTRNIDDFAVFALPVIDPWSS